MFTERKRSIRVIGVLSERREESKGNDNEACNDNRNKHWPMLQRGDIFQRARYKFNRDFGKLKQCLPKIQSNKDLLTNLLYDKIKEDKDYNIKRAQMLNSIRLNKDKEKDLLKPIQSLNYIKKQLVHIKAIEERSHNRLSLKRIIFKRKSKQHQPIELSSLSKRYNSQETSTVLISHIDSNQPSHPNMRDICLKQRRLNKEREFDKSQCI